MENKIKNVETICFKCIANRNNENKTFQRYIKIKYIIAKDNDIMIGYRIYGCKIVENKGIPLINVGYKITNIISNDLEEIAAICLNIPIDTVVETNIIDENIFDFMIQQQ